MRSSTLSSLSFCIQSALLLASLLVFIVHHGHTDRNNSSLRLLKKMNDAKRQPVSAHVPTVAEPASNGISLLPRNEEGMNHRSLRDIQAIHGAIDEARILRGKKGKKKKSKIFKSKKKSSKAKTSSKSKSKKSKKCEESDYVIRAILTVTDDSKIAKKVGKALDGLDYWTTFCTDQQIIETRRLTTRMDATERRLLLLPSPSPSASPSAMPAGNLEVFVYGTTDNESELNDNIDGDVTDAIEGADKDIDAVESVTADQLTLVPSAAPSDEPSAQL